MWYGYRLNDQKDWVKIKEFDTLEDYKNYIDKKHISYSMCSTKEVDLRGKALLIDGSNTIRTNPYTKSRKSE